MIQIGRNDLPNCKGKKINAHDNIQENKSRIKKNLSPKQNETKGGEKQEMQIYF